MTDQPTFGNKFIKPEARVLVVGLGKSGIAMARFFKKLGADVSATEKAGEDQLDRHGLAHLTDLGIDYETGRHSKDLFTAADFIFVSPGIPLDLKEFAVAKSKGVPILGEMALARPYLRTPLVAITGTNGKSTVTALVGDLLRAAGKKVFVGGNIGTPLTEYLLGPQDADAAVLEVSSFQLDTAAEFKPEVAVLLNISPDHLDRYKNYEEYVKSKFLIFANQQENDVAIVNADDPEIMKRADLWGTGRQYFFGKDVGGKSGATFRGKNLVLQGLEKDDGESYDLAGTLFESEPNNFNALAAILAARSLGCPSDAIGKVIKKFVPLPHRMALVGEIDGVRYYDDSKATNIGAVKAALEAMKVPVVLIAGGRDKGGDYDGLKDVVSRKVKAMVLIGEAAEKMGRAFKEVTFIGQSRTMEDAVLKAKLLASEGDAVLLSPACASFDMFSGYGQRGEVFCAAVKKIKGHVSKRSVRKPLNINTVSIPSGD